MTPISKSGNFTTDFALLPTSFQFSATFSSAGSTVSTVSCSEIRERLSAMNSHIENIFTELQAISIDNEASVLVSFPNNPPAPVQMQAPVLDVCL